MKKDELTREVLVGAANDLNKVLGLKPPIVVEFESSLKGAALKAVEGKFLEQLQKDVAESGALVTATDTVEPKTIDVLKALGVKDIWTKLVSGGTAPAPANEKAPGKEKAMKGKVTKKAQAPAGGKKVAAPKKVKAETTKKVVEKDQYGFRKGSKSSEAIKLVADGKMTIVDIRKKFDMLSFHKLVVDLEGRGFKVKEDKDGKGSITGKLKS